jgi:Na+/phosphate symporter
VPDRPQADDPGRPRHLDPNVLDTPAEALACAMRETLNLGDKVADMLRQTMQALENNDARTVKAIEAADDAVDHLYEAIKLYLVQTSRNELGEEDGRRYVEILTFTTNLEQCRRHHRQEPDGTRHQEDQESLFVLGRRHEGAARLPRPGPGETCGWR